MNWEIADLKKTINQIHDLLLVNNNSSVNIENHPTEQWQLPIADNASLESLEEFLKQDKNIELLVMISNVHLYFAKMFHFSYFFSRVNDCIFVGAKLAIRLYF